MVYLITVSLTFKLWAFWYTSTYLTVVFNPFSNRETDHVSDAVTRATTPTTEELVYVVYMYSLSPPSYLVNSLWPGDAIWRHRSRSTLAQEMAITLTNVGLSSVRFGDIYSRANSHEIPKLSIAKFTPLKVLSNLPEANELMCICSIL